MVLDIQACQASVNEIGRKCTDLEKRYIANESQISSLTDKVDKIQSTSSEFLNTTVTAVVTEVSEQRRRGFNVMVSGLLELAETVFLAITDRARTLEIVSHILDNADLPVANLPGVKV